MLYSGHVADHASVVLNLEKCCAFTGGSAAAIALWKGCCKECTCTVEDKGKSKRCVNVCS